MITLREGECIFILSSEFLVLENIYTKFVQRIKTRILFPMDYFQKKKRAVYEVM